VLKISFGGKMFKSLLAITCLSVASFAIASDQKWGVFVSSTAEIVSGKKQQNVSEIFIPVHQTEDNMTFIDLRGQLSKGDKGAISLGFGHRRKLNDSVAIGANASYDSSRTLNGNKANQAALGVELFVKKTSLKVNFSRPVGSSSNQIGNEIVNYAHLDGDKIMINKSAMYEAIMGGYSLELGHQFDLANGVTLSGDITYFNYSEDGYESYTGTRATVSATKSLEYWGIDGSFGGYVGLENNNINGTDVVAGITAKFYLGNKGKRRGSSKFSYLDRQMGSGISRRSTSVTGTKYDDYSVAAATEIYGRKFSYIKQLDAEDNIAAEVSNADNNGKIILLNGTKGAIQITEDINIADNNVVIGKGKAFLVTGPNGEQATLILDEDAATIATQNSSRIGLGNNSILADMSVEDASIHADSKEDISLINVDMVRENIATPYSTITITNSKNILLDNVTVEDHADHAPDYYDEDQDDWRKNRHENGVHAVAINFSEGIQVMNSNFYSQYSRALFTYDSTEIEVTGSEFGTTDLYAGTSVVRFDVDNGKGGNLTFAGNTVNGGFSSSDFSMINISGNTFNGHEVRITNLDDNPDGSFPEMQTIHSEGQVYTVLHFHDNDINFVAPKVGADNADNDLSIETTNEVYYSGNDVIGMEEVKFIDNEYVQITDSTFDGDENEGRIEFLRNHNVVMTKDSEDNRNTVTGYQTVFENSENVTVTHTDFSADEEQDASVSFINDPTYTADCNEETDNFPACFEDMKERGVINFNNNTITDGNLDAEEQQSINMSGNIMTNMDDISFERNGNVTIVGDEISGHGSFAFYGNGRVEIKENSKFTIIDSMNFESNENVLVIDSLFDVFHGLNFDSNDNTNVSRNTVNTGGQNGIRFTHTRDGEQVIDGNIITMRNLNNDVYGIKVENSDGVNITNNSVVLAVSDHHQHVRAGLFLGNADRITVSGLTVEGVVVDVVLDDVSELNFSGGDSRLMDGTALNHFVVRTINSVVNSTFSDNTGTTTEGTKQSIIIGFSRFFDSGNVTVTQSIEGQDGVRIGCGFMAPVDLTSIENGFIFNTCPELGNDNNDGIFD
jgi:hypothetical protein